MSLFKKPPRESLDDVDFKKIRARARMMLAQPGDQPTGLTALFSQMAEDERAIFRASRSHQIKANEPVFPDQVPSRS